MKVPGKPKVSAILPAYNEEAGVAGTLKDLAEVLSRCCEAYELIVIDDGSSDGTAAIAEEAGATVIRHPVNGGYGRALVSGLCAASHDFILMTDADGTYPAAEAEKLLEHAQCDMVVGARQGRIFWGNPLQAFLRWVYLTLAGFVVGEPLPDANSGFRLFKKSVFKRTMPFICLGYSFSTTMTLSFINSGRFVKHVPINYLARKGRSKVRPVRDILRTLQIMTQIMLFYNPLKPAALAAAALWAIASAAGWRMCSGGYKAGGAVAFILLFGLGLVTFLVGCLLDARRMQRSGKENPDILSDY